MKVGDLAGPESNEAIDYYTTVVVDGPGLNCKPSVLLACPTNVGKEWRGEWFVVHSIVRV